MNITLIRKPDAAELALVKECAFVTANKEVKRPPDSEWLHSMLEARHSPIRELRFVFKLEGIPYWVSTHLARHKHAEPYIQSQRNDRQSDYDRNTAPQDAPVNMIYSVNAEELMTIANKRLCKQASPETRAVVREMCLLVLNDFPEFTGLLVPSCMYNGMCHEMHPCKEGMKK